MDRDFVTFSERNLRGRKQWREQLANYTGVLRRTVTGKRTTFYLIDLYHEDESKRINLYRAPEEGEVREKWENYARVLRLPALEQGEGGTLRREVEDLDRSVADLIEEGKVHVDFDILRHKAKGLAVDFEGNTVMITRTAPERPWPGIVVMGAFPLPFLAIGLLGSFAPWWVRIIFGAAGVWTAIQLGVPIFRDIVSRQRLRVGSRVVEIGTVSSRGEKTGTRIPINEIESVTISGEARYSIPAVVIASDRAVIKFGKNLPRQSLNFIMNTVLAIVAEGRGGRGGADGH